MIEYIKCWQYKLTYISGIRTISIISTAENEVLPFDIIVCRRCYYCMFSYYMKVIIFLTNILIIYHQAVEVVQDQTTLGATFVYGCPRCRGCQLNCPCILKIGNLYVELPIRPIQPNKDGCPFCSPCPLLLPRKCPTIVSQCTLNDVYDKMY